MKKSLLFIALLTALTVSGCKHKKSDTHPTDESTQSESSGEKESESTETDQKEAAAEVVDVINELLDYQGTMSVESTTYEPGSTIPVTERATYDAGTNEYAEEDSYSLKVAVPEDNNLSKIYDVDKEDEEYSEYSIASQSYAGHLLAEFIKDESSSMAFSVLKGSSKATINDEPDLFKALLTFELVDSMLKGLNCTGSPDDAITSFNIKENEDGSKTASYKYEIVGTPKQGEYPYGEIKLDFSIDYTDKIIHSAENMQMKVYMNETNSQAMSMVSEVEYGYEFDEEFYASAKEEASKVTTQSTDDGGYIKNGLLIYLNGVALLSSPVGVLTPNEDLTTKKMTDWTKNYFATLDRLDVQGIYVDEECETLFQDKKSTDYLETIYVKATPKEGYTTVVIKNAVEYLKGDIPLTDEEFEALQETMGAVKERKELYAVPTDSSFVFPIYTSPKYTLQSMYLNGEKFTTCVIEEEDFSSSDENELVLNYFINGDEEGDEVYPVSLASRLISNDENGIVFFGPCGNERENYFKLSTEDFVKEDPTYAISARLSDYLLEPGDEIPATSPVMDETMIQIKFIVGENTYTELPADYSGEFLLSIKLTYSNRFVYISIQ